MLTIAGTVSVWSAAPEQTPETGPEQTILVTNSPAASTPRHAAMMKVIGTHKDQHLRMTRGHAVTMSAAHLPKMRKSLEKLGAKVTVLGPDWNRVMKPEATPPRMSPEQRTAMAKAKATEGFVGANMVKVPEMAAIEYALTKDTDVASAQISIVIPINDKERITARRVDLRSSEKGYTWYGTVEGTDEPVMLMMWQDGHLTGMFGHGGHVYTVWNIGNRLQAVVESDPMQLPLDHASHPIPRQGNANLRDDPLVTRGEAAPMWQAMTGEAAAPKPAIEPMLEAEWEALSSTKFDISVMFLYTPKAASHYVADLADTFALAIEQTNRVFRNSGLKNIELHTVLSQQINYDESKGEYFQHLYAMVDGAGVFKDVHRLRDEKKADIVILIVDDPSGCGLSTRVAADSDEAYAVVHHACAATMYSIAHEIGHLFGARHDRAIDDTDSPFAFGHGYVNGMKWRDVMSYPQACNGCPRIPYFSNPNVSYKGEPTGSADADAVRAILQRAEVVSKFR